MVLGACAGKQASSGTPATPAPKGLLAVGTPAPDFRLASATRAGVSAPVHLADLRGKTVVIAFFYRARTKG
jgi:peroxiredoxin